MNRGQCNNNYSILQFLDTSTEFLFGESTECMNPNTPFETDEFMQAFDRSLLGLALLLILGPLRWPLYLDPGWKKAYTKVHSFVDTRVERALEKQRKSEQEIDGPRRYILLEEMAKQTQDLYELRMQILNVFFPARDTAAIAFANIMFELARHPLEWAKLKKEVATISPSQSLSFEFLRSLKITKAIINESLRLHPAASRLSKTSLRDSVLPKGGGSNGQFPIFVPKGTVVEMDLYTLQRNPEIWGSDSDKFKPDRWLDPRRPLWEAKWQYEPFLGGIRMCPAQNMVLIQLTYILVRFAQEFKMLENKDEEFDYFEAVAMTVESKRGVIIAVDRNE
jgi:cytochrome P450